MKYLQKYGKQENSMTYCSNTTTPYITRMQQTKGCILPFPKKGNLEIAKNFWGINFTSIATKIYNALLLNHIKPAFEKILRNNQNVFWKNQFTSQILTICHILGVCAKNLKATLLSVDFSKAFDSNNKRKMEQMLLAYGLPKENITAIKMLYKNTKIKVCSLVRDTDFFDVTGVLQENTLAPPLFIICPDYVLWT